MASPFDSSPRVRPAIPPIVTLTLNPCIDESASVEQVVPTEDLAGLGPVQAMKISRLMTHGVVEAPKGAHFTECVPDYGRDEAFQRAYTASAKSDEAWDAFRAKYIDVTEDEYQRAIHDGGRGGAT